MAKRARRPRDPNVLAKLIVDMATGEAPLDPGAAAGYSGDLGAAEGWAEGREGPR